METIEGVIKFLSAYPAWAKLVVLINITCIASVLVFARVPAPISEAQAQPAGSHALRIKGVELYASSEQAEIQVSAFVNGTEFHYPSLAGVQWLRVGPAMTGQLFRLPKAERYELRFEMRKREKPGGEITRFVSQETVPLTKATSGTYGVHFLDNRQTKAAPVSAQIAYAFESAP